MNTREESPLDTAVFGFPVFRSNAETAEQIADDLDAAKSKGGKLFILRLSTDHIALAQRLIGDGFLLTDVLTHFRIRVTEALANEAEARALPCRFAQEGEEEQLVEVARRSFRGRPNHYRSDERLNPQRCDELYAESMRSFYRARSRQSEILVIEKGGRPVGVTVLRMPLQSDGEGAFAAVDPSERGGDGLKIYRSLVLRGIQLGYHRGFARALVASSSRNVVVHKVLVRTGYVPTGYEYTFHYWLNR